MTDPAEQAPYTLEWYIDENGRDVVHDWITNDLTPTQRRVIGLAMYEILQFEGEQVADGEFGTHLGDGLYEFRVRQSGDEILSRSRRPSVRERLQTVTRVTKKKKGESERILLRVFFHAHGDKLILLLGGYDKGRDPSKRRQQKEIEVARKRLGEWRRSGRSTV